MVTDLKNIKIGFYPDKPMSCQKVWYFKRNLNFKFTEINDSDVCILWDKEFTINKEQKGLINGGCLDTTKLVVDKAFDHVFGYSTQVDEGICGRKSIYQSRKDLKVIDYDGNPQKGYIYQKIFKDPLEIRMIIFDRQIDCIRLFNARKDAMDYTLDLDLFTSREERNKIISFCHYFKLDYGEIDCMRDEKGKLYIIDVNNIPGDRCFYIMKQERKDQYEKRLTEGFKNMILKRL